MASFADISIRFFTNLKQVSTQLQNANRQLQVAGQQMKKTGAALTVGLTAPITALGVQSVKTFTDFEDSLAKVQAVSGATAVEFAKLKENAEALGGATRFTASQVAELQLNLSKLGFNPDEILQATEAILQLALATGEDLAESATVAASTLRGFGLEADQTQRVVDVMAASFSSSALDLSKFSTAMGVVAPVAAAAGQSIEQVTGLLGVLVNAGIDASTAGTALRNIFLEIATRGITLDQALSQINGAADKSVAALDLFGKRGATVATVLANNIDQAKDFTQAFEDAGGAAADMAAIMDNTLKGSFARLQSAFESVFIAIGQQIAPVVRSVADRVAELAASFKELTPAAQKAVIVIGGIAAALGPVLVTAGFIITNVIPGLVSGFALLKTSVLSLTAVIAANPIGALVIGVTALVTTLALAGSRLKALTDVSQQLAQVNEKAARSIAREKAELNQLLATAKNETISKEKRLVAIRELNKLVPEYNKELTLETVNTKKAEVATKKYIDRLLQKARVLAAEEKLVEIQKQLLDLQLGQNEAIKPSLWQNFTNSLKSLGSASQFTANSLASVVENTQAEGAALTETARLLSEFVSKNKQAADSVDTLTDAAGKLKKTVGPGGLAEVLGVGSFAAASSIVVTSAEEIHKALVATADLVENKVAPALDLATAKAIATANRLNEEGVAVIQEAAAGILSGFGQLIAGFASGAAGAQQLANLMLSTLGDLMIRLGEVAIQTAVGLAAIELAFKSLNPVIAAAAGVALIAFGNIIKGAIRKAPGEVAFASGGIVYGPTRALVGEYPGASNNPEVIAPLNKLKDLLGVGSGVTNVSIDGVIKGTDIELVVDRVLAQKSRYR